MRRGTSFRSALHQTCDDSPAPLKRRTSKNVKTLTFSFGGKPFYVFHRRRFLSAQYTLAGRTSDQWVFSYSHHITKPTGCQSLFCKISAFFVYYDEQFDNQPHLAAEWKDFFVLKSDFYYDLPKELIAQHPLDQRDHSRLMTLSKQTGEIGHYHFYDLESILRPGDLLVVNNSRVIPARIYGHKKDTGSHVEFLLLEQKEQDVWEILVKPGKKAKMGVRYTFGDGLLEAERAISE